MTTAVKVWTKEEMRQKLEKNDNFVLRGLLNLLSLQTQDERLDGNTKYHNGVGFNGRDAQFLTELTKKYVRYGYLTPKQMLWARKKILKYAGQLARVANKELKTDVDRVIKEVKNGTAQY